MPPLLTKREKEFIKDWFKVVEGKMSKAEFYSKWGSKKDDTTIVQDLHKIETGEMSVEEFRKKWTRKGDWKNYVRVMRYRILKKFKEGRKELLLIKKFLELRELP